MTENTDAMIGRVVIKSVTECGVITKLINATFVIKLKIDIRYENFSDEGFIFVNNHLL